MDKNIIKNQLRMEAKVPGIAQTEKVQKETGKENKGYYKDVEKKMAGYEKDTTKGGKDEIEPVMTNYTDDWAKEYHEDMEIMNGQEMLHYQNSPDKKFVERATMSIEGDAMMGNSPEWANVVEKGQGGDPDYGKTLVARIKSSQKKRQDATPTLDQFGDDIEEKNVGVEGTKSAIKPIAAGKRIAVESKTENKGRIMETKKIKRLTFKNQIGGLNNAKAIIPESYKVDKKVFEVTDGNENYRFRWEGDNTGEAVALKSSVKTEVNEDMEHMKHLMGFKSDLGRLNPVERLNENDQFKKLFNKVITEQSEADTEGLSVGDMVVPGRSYKNEDEMKQYLMKVTNIEGDRVFTVDEKGGDHSYQMPDVRGVQDALGQLHSSERTGSIGNMGN